MKNLNLLYQIRNTKYQIRLTFLILVFTFYFLNFNLSEAKAEFMRSDNYNLEQTNLNMTSGKKTSPDSGISITDTVGQTASGLYTSNGYIIKSGFQYYYSIIPFTFKVSKTSINLGSITAKQFATESAVLTVNAGTAYGYSVKVVEDDQLRVDPTIFIPDTSCDLANPCSLATAPKPWVDRNRSFGFGYNMKGTDAANGFTDSNYFLPFPSDFDGSQPTTVMSGTNAGRSKQATITLKVNVSDVQEAGQYQNVIKFIAIPRY